MFTPVRLVVVATTSLAVLALCLGPASATAPMSIAASAAGTTEAESLGFNDAVDNAAALVRASADTGGLFGMSSDQANGELRVMWKAPIPSAVAALDGKAVDGVSIRLVDSKYSQSEIVQASDALISASTSGKLGPISYVSGTNDGSGLIIGLDPKKVGSDEQSKLVEAAQQLTGLDITTEQGLPPTPTGRQNDSDPWYGGGMMEDPGYNPPADMTPFNFCSTGFAAVLPNGYGRLLSARHCDAAGDLAWKNGQHLPLTNGGADVDIQNTNDTMLIDPIGGTGGWVHGGPWNATSTNSRYHLKIASAGSPVQNQIVCTSGANSGEHCGLSVTSPSLTTWACEYPGTCHGWRARNPGINVVSVVGGDSGGPVYQSRSDGRVNARGIIYGGDTDIACGSVRWPVGNCYVQVWFIDITLVTTAWGVTVETTP